MTISGRDRSNRTASSLPDLKWYYQRSLYSIVSVVESTRKKEDSYRNEVSGGTGIPEILFSGHWNQPKKGFSKARRTMLFITFSFNQIWWFFKLMQHLRHDPLGNLIIYGKNLEKIEEKPCLTCLQVSTHFSTVLRGFWYPNNQMLYIGWSFFRHCCTTYVIMYVFL